MSELRTLYPEIEPFDSGRHSVFVSCNFVDRL